MKNRIASLFLAFALLMSLCNFAAARDNLITVRSGGAERFTDVPADHWAYAYIDKVVGSGLFNGKTETTFEPSNAMTRSQFVLVMDRMEGMSSLEGVPTQTIFPDVAPTRRAAGPIQWANEQGFVLGFGDGTFKPDSPITRGQFAALIYRYILAKKYTKLHVVDPEPAQFVDADSVSNAFKEAVEYARVHGLLTGYSDGTVRASNPITRAAIAAILARFLDLVSESGYTPLLDARDEGGSVDSGDSVNPPVDVPTSYDDIRLKAAAHGATTISSVLRNGAQITDSDAQPGDVVTITHTPESGYRVGSVHVRDSKGKTVRVTTKGNVSTFTMPENLPVTVTVSYVKESGGGGGGGGGTPSPDPVYFALQVNAEYATEADSAKGTVWLSRDPVTDANYDQFTDKDNRRTLTINNQTTNPIPFYVVLEYGANVTPACEVMFNNVALTAGTPTEFAVTERNVRVIRYVANSLSNVAANNVATVTASFSTGTQSDVTTDIQWNVSANIDTDKANYRLVTEKPANIASAARLAETDAASKNVPVTVPTDTKIAAAPGKIWLEVSPKVGYDFDGVPAAYLAGDSEQKDAKATIAAPESNADDTYRVYEISKSDFSDASYNTLVTMSMSVEMAIDHTHNITVNSYLVDASGAETPLTDNDPVKASADPKATWQDTVTVKVPTVLGFGGYILATEAPLNKADKAPSATSTDDKTPNVTLTKDSSGNYTFTMPDGDVTVNVYYQKLSNDELAYAVKLNVTGNGAASLNIAGKTQTVSVTSGDSFTYYVTLKTEKRTVTETVSGSDTEKEIEVKSVNVGDSSTGDGLSALKESDYAELLAADVPTDYQAKHSIPVYLDGTPIPGKGYKLTTNVDELPVPVKRPASADGTAAEMDQAKLYALEANADNTLTIDVTFEKIKSYGYNLTVIGPDSVDVDFNGASNKYSGSSAAPQTYSSGLVVIDANEAELTVTLPEGYEPENDVYAKGGIEAESLKVTYVDADGNPQEPKKYAYNDTEAVPGRRSAKVSLQDGQLVSLVAEFHKADRTAVPFTVTVSGEGTVTVTPESGKILPADKVPDGGDPTALLKAGTDAQDNDELPNADSATRTYYAFSDTVITLTTKSDKKVYSILVWDNNGAELHDVMNKAGFSFQLKSEVTAEATFSDLDSYSVLLQAPNLPADSDIKGLSTSSAKISPDETIQDVIYSLNDGTQLAAENGTNRTKGKGTINNVFISAPDKLNKTVAFYLHDPRMVKTDDGTQSGADALGESLAATVEANIGTILPKMIEDRKNSLKSNPDTVEKPLHDRMVEAQNSLTSDPQSISGTAKAEVLDSILSVGTYRTNADGSLFVQNNPDGSRQLQVALNGSTLKQLYDNKVLKDSDFTVTAEVTPILTKDKEDELIAANSGNSDITKKLTGSSAETQLKALVNNYLDNITIKADYDALKTNVVATCDGSTPPVLNISANITLNAGGSWPALQTEVKMADSADQLSVSALIKISEITVRVGNVNARLPLTDAALPAVVYDVSQFDITPSPKATISQKLAQIDADVNAMWETEFGKLLNDAKTVMSIDMGNVLDADLLRNVVNELVKSPSETATTKVQSLGDAATTRAAISKFADEFIKIEGRGTDLTLSLQNKGKGGKPTPLGKIQDGALVMTIDFEDILRDAEATPDADTSSYEELVDLVMNIRDGISEDIRVTLEKDTEKQSQTSEAVVASMIEKQIRQGRGSLTANKWGSTINNSNMTPTERKEISAMVAKLIMDSDIKDSDLTMEKMWKDFEANGYRSVELVFKLNAQTHGGLDGIMKSLNSAIYGENSSQAKDNLPVDVVLKVEQKLKDPTPAS